MEWAKRANKEVWESDCGRFLITAVLDGIHFYLEDLIEDDIAHVGNFENCKFIAKSLLKKAARNESAPPAVEKL